VPAPTISSPIILLPDQFACAQRLRNLSAFDVCPMKS
jgi:hypothetical protein